MRIVAISDTHGRHRQLSVPDGDVLVHAGDFMVSGTRLYEITDFSNWLMEQPHQHKIIIAGNHDIYFEKEPVLATARLDKSITYLCDSGCDIDGVKFWGSPYQPEFYNWAFNVPRGPAIKEHWDLIPRDTDVLITHGPAHGWLDTVNRDGEHLGCEELRTAIKRVRPQFHIFGHIHGGAGRAYFPPQEPDNWQLTSANVSMMDESYKVVNVPFVIDVPDVISMPWC
jgi:predicted phosphodiesterase